MHDRSIALPAIESTNEAEVWLGSDQALGVIYLRDEIRPAAKRVIDFLKLCGLSVTLLTGDRVSPASIVAEQVGINDVRRAESTGQAAMHSRLAHIGKEGRDGR